VICLRLVEEIIKQVLLSTLQDKLMFVRKD